MLKQFDKNKKMPTETLEPTTAETSTVKPEVAGRLLGVLVAKRASYHKGRVLESFEDGKLPDLPTNSTADRLQQSDRRYHKASDLLYREHPAPVPPAEEGISGPLLVSLADNLAWRGMELSVADSHLGEVRAASNQVSANSHSDS